MKPLYELRNITQRFGEREVLNLAELDIEQGEIHALLGPNGAGKSTLLHILSFLTLPKGGTMNYAGVPVSFQEKKLRELRQSVVLLDQSPILFSTSVFKNVEYGLKIRKVSKRTRAKKVHEALDLVGMRSFEQADGRFLSGGETRRVAIARVLACSPQVLLLDEPMAGIDAENQEVIEKIIKNIHQQHNITIILCTHNLSRAARLAHQKYHLYNGKLNSPTHENIFSGPVVSKNGKNYCRLSGSLQLRVPDSMRGEVKIAIDPEKILLVDNACTTPGQKIQGRVTKLEEVNGCVRVFVNAGVNMSFSLEKATYQQNGLRIDSEITVLCPDDCVEVL